MSGVAEGKLRSLGPWPDGTNNVASEENLPKNQVGKITSLRSATNFDIDLSGTPSRREGYTKKISATRAHSLFEAVDASVMLAVVDSNLNAYNVNLQLAATVRAAIGDRYASYAATNEDVYWSNGLQIRRMSPDLVDHPVWLPTPPSPFAAVSVSGGLDAGEYSFAFTWLDAGGRESGASPATMLVVPANGGALLTNLPPAVESATTLRVYVSPPNGAEMYQAIDLPAGQTTILIGAHSPGIACKTMWMQPLPPGDIVRFGLGRVFVASANMLQWSEALSFGLMHQDSTLRFGAHITMMEPVGEGGDGSGIYIADHKRTYFMSGSKPDDWQRTIRYGHSVVPGTSTTVPGSLFGLDSTAPVAFWLASNGVFCLGLPNGTVQPIREGQLALPYGEHGASVAREYDGIRQMLTNYVSDGANVLAAKDSMSVTVRRNGVVLT